MQNITKNSIFLLDANSHFLAIMLHNMIRGNVIFTISCLALFLTASASARTIQFEEEILPILQEKCWSCHSSRNKEPSAGLLLDTPEQLLKGNEYGPVITRMLPNESVLVERIALKPSKRGIMPPTGKGEPCSPKQIALIRDWIKQGAKTGNWKGFEKPKREYQPKDQSRNSPLADSQYAQNDKNPGLELTPMPIHNMRISHSLIQAKAKKIDTIIARHRASKGAKNQKVVNDRTFLRRAYLEIIGRIPTLEESMQFLSSTQPKKRMLLIDQLIASEGYVSHWFHFWADLLKVDSSKGNQVAAVYYADWLKRALRSNMPYNQLAQELITASGMPHQNGATGWIASDQNMKPDHMANTVQAFMGVQIQCAQCHDHPFDRWNQFEFQSMVSYYAGVQYNVRGGNQIFVNRAREAGIEKLPQKQDRFFRQLGGQYTLSIWEPQFNRWHTLPNDYQYADAKPRQQVRPAVMFGDQPHIEGSPRRAFAEWVTSKDNEFFAESIANRLWKQLMGVGLIEPIDEIKYHTEPAVPELLDELSDMIVTFNFNLKDVLRVLYNTRTWQMETRVEDLPEDYTQYAYDGRPLRRMSAEQMWDSIVSLAIVDLDERKGHGSKYVTDEYKQRLEDTYLMPIEKLVKTYNEEFIDNYREKTRKEQRQAYTLYMQDANGERLKDHNGKPLRETKTYSYFNFGSWSNDHMTDPRWRGMERGLVRASELPSPAPGYHFVRQFGQSDRQSISTGTRAPNVTQALALLNGPIYQALDSHNSLLANELKKIKTRPEKINAIFRATLTRNPTAEDTEIAEHVLANNYQKKGQRMLLWALINTREFMYIQ